MNSSSDNEIMLKVKSGNLEMLGLLYERYKKWLYNFFQQMYCNPDISEDLVQNVFVRILKYKHTYTEDSNFVTWLFQIARNESHSYYNKHIKNRASNDLDTISYKLSESQNSHENLEVIESVKMLNQALEKLPYEKKEIITLSKLKQLKYKEIGEILGCSEANARIKAHRALQDLKTTFMSMQKY